MAREWRNHSSSGNACRWNQAYAAHLTTDSAIIKAVGLFQCRPKTVGVWSSVGAFSGLSNDNREDQNMTDRILRRSAVDGITGLGRSTIYDWMARGEFPKPVQLGARLVGWRESDIRAWLESRQPKTGG